MNLRGSYRALRNNSKSAILAAIEIYNKPQITYRDECFTILLVNGWELLFKAILSKNKQSIFYPKKKNQPYKSLTLQDAMEQCVHFFPNDVLFAPVSENIRILTDYRNNAIHFYNQRGFEVVIYGLAQTSIMNYRDLMLSIFKIDISKEINLGLLPLSVGSQPDPIVFLQKAKDNPPKSEAVASFINEISQVTQDLESKHIDTSRFLTVFRINFQSVKKVSSADVVAAVDSSFQGTPAPVERRVDPNKSHPESQKTIVKKIGSSLKGVKFSEYVFQAIVWKYDIKNKEHLCWRATNGTMIAYSTEVISFIKGLTKGEVEDARKAYREHLRLRKKVRHKGFRT